MKCSKSLKDSAKICLFIKSLKYFDRYGLKQFANVKLAWVWILDFMCLSLIQIWQILWCEASVNVAKTRSLNMGTSSVTNLLKSITDRTNHVFVSTISLKTKLILAPASKVLWSYFLSCNWLLKCLWKKSKNFGKIVVFYWGGWTWNWNCCL